MAALGKVLWLIAALVLGGSAMAADLATCNLMDVNFVYRLVARAATPRHVRKNARYSLIVSIEAAGVAVDLYTPITTQTTDPKGDGTGGSGHKL